MIFQSDPGSAQETRHPRGDLNLFELRPGAGRRGTRSSPGWHRAVLRDLTHHTDS